MTQITKYKIATAVEAVDRVTRPMRRMEDATDRFARKAERDFSRAEKAADRFQDSVQGRGRGRGMRGGGGAGGLSSTALFGIGALGLTAGGLAASATAAALLASNTNIATARVENLSRALDMEPTAMRALGHEVAAIGLEIEHVADIAEEFRNKVGEAIRLGNMTELEEGLTSIGLTVDGIAKKAESNPMGAFVDTLSALTEISKRQGRTAAVSAADQIFGSEGNRIAGLLLANGRTWDEILERFERMNFLTEEGRRGAMRYASAWRDTRLIIGSMFSEFSGLSGDRVGGWLESFNAAIMENKEAVRTWGAAIWEVLDFTSSSFDNLDSLIASATGPEKFLLNMLKLLGLARAAWVELATFFADKFLTVLGAVGKAIDWVLGKLGIDLNEELERSVGQLESVVTTLERVNAGGPLIEWGDNSDGARPQMLAPSPYALTPAWAAPASIGMADVRTIREERMRTETRQNRLIIEDRTGTARLEDDRDENLELRQTGTFNTGGR